MSGTRCRLPTVTDLTAFDKSLTIDGEAGFDVIHFNRTTATLADDEILDLDAEQIQLTLSDITVGGTGYRNDTVYTGSSRGPAQWGNVDPWNDWSYQPGPGLIKPDLALPGVLVNSTVIPSGYSGDSWTGTSMACPHAAGCRSPPDPEPPSGA